MFSKREIQGMSDTSLRIAFDGAAARVSNDWRRGNPGAISDITDLALIRFEADIRCLPLSPVRLPGQLSLL